MPTLTILFKKHFQYILYVYIYVYKNVSIVNILHAILSVQLDAL